MTPRLWCLSYSPWSDQARWALDHCGVAYERRAYQPLLGEPGLRLRLRKWSGPVSVPILETSDGVLSDSFDIASWADRHAVSDDRRIFSAGTVAEVRAYDQRAQQTLAAGRVLGLRRILEDEAALGELVPGRVRRMLGGASLKLAAFGVRRTFHKYADVTPDDLEQTLRAQLERIQAELAAAPVGPEGVRTLLGTFSYADIVTAESLSFIVPPATHLRLGAASRRAYTHPSLASEAPEVFAWRDALFAQRATDGGGRGRPGPEPRPTSRRG